MKLHSLTFFIVTFSILSNAHSVAIDCNAPHQDIYSLAQFCSSITKIGDDNTVKPQDIFVSLSKFPHTRPNYLEIQLNNLPDEAFQRNKEMAAQYHVDYNFWRANDTYIMLETSDMLIIDAHHRYDQLNNELNTFASRVRKFICIKNATGPWEYQDDDVHFRGYASYSSSTYRGCNGIRLAVIDFLQKNPEWEGVYQTGYTILRRRSSANLYETAHDEHVDEILRKRMVLCTGPSFGRYDLLQQVTETDSQVIPFKKIFVVTNDPKIANIKFANKNYQCKVIPFENHQLGCTNCIIESLKNAAEDPSVQDDDIILFKHETVFINDMNLIKRAIGKLLENYDMVACYWEPSTFKPKYTDAFFIKVSAVRKHLSSLNQTTTMNNLDCEHYLTGLIFNKIKVYEIPSRRETGEHTELGFYHIPPRTHGNIWDKRNYFTIY